MLGLMAALGVKLSFFNLAVLPIVLGVGNDAGVHLAAASDRRTVLRVLVAAGTTVLGFAGLLVTGHPGLVSLGAAAVLGVLTTLAACLLLAPALARPGSP